MGDRSIAALALVYLMSFGAMFVGGIIMNRVIPGKIDPLLIEIPNLLRPDTGALFKKIAGKSVSEFILDLRIYEAKEMLIRTDMTIEEISESIGFNNSFYFSKCFKAQIKISPSEFRNMMKLR